MERPPATRTREPRGAGPEVPTTYGYAAWVRKWRSARSLQWLIPHVFNTIRKLMAESCGSMCINRTSKPTTCPPQTLRGPWFAHIVGYIPQEN